MSAMYPLNYYVSCELVLSKSLDKTIFKMPLISSLIRPAVWGDRVQWLEPACLGKVTKQMPLYSKTTSLTNSTAYGVLNNMGLPYCSMATTSDKQVPSVGIPLRCNTHKHLYGITDNSVHSLHYFAVVNEYFSSIGPIALFVGEGITVFDIV